METLMYIKVNYEGEFQSILDLIASREWKVEIKEIDINVVYMQLPTDIEEEVFFFKNIIFDEKTNTKFGDIVPISKKEYDEAVELAKSEELNQTKENEKSSLDKPKKQMIEEMTNEEKIKSKEKDKQEIANQEFMRTISGKVAENSKIKNINDKKDNKISNQININDINLLDIFKQKFAQYKNPYEFFMSQNYICNFIIIAAIILFLS